jgi:hypothetical protein
MGPPWNMYAKSNDVEHVATSTIQTAYGLSSYFPWIHHSVTVIFLTGTSLTFTVGFQFSVIHNTNDKFEVPYFLFLPFVVLIISQEHRILGDALCLLDSEGLKAVGVSTIGQRLSILKAVYNLKLAHNVPIHSDHYVPQCMYFIQNLCAVYLI